MSDRRGIVYLATNNINGKQYIGKTIMDWRIRLRHHRLDAKKGSPMVFHRAIRKHGFESFSWVVLLQNITEDRLFVEEERLIALHNTRVPNGYNNASKGPGPIGFRHTNESRERIRIASTGRFHTDETKARMSATKKANPLPSHVIQRIANIRRGKEVRLETRAKMSASAKLRRNRVVTEKTRDKIRESLLNHPVSENTKAKLRQAWNRRRQKMTELRIQIQQSDLSNVTKVCTKCKTDKQLSEFVKQPRNIHGAGSWCIECSRRYHRDRQRLVRSGNVRQSMGSIREAAEMEMSCQST